MNTFERNDNHIELVCVINRKLNTQLINMFHLNRWSYRIICHIELCELFSQSSYSDVTVPSAANNQYITVGINKNAIIYFYD